MSQLLRPSLRHFILVSTIAFGSIGSCCIPAKRVFYQRDDVELKRFPPLTALFVPIGSVVIKENARTAPKQSSQIDSFFIDAANSLLANELSQHFKMIPCTTKTPSVPLGDALRYSRLRNSKEQKKTEVSEAVRILATSCNADVIVVVYECSVKQNVYQPKGWRGGKYESGHYGRPTSYQAATSVHLQIWSAEGKLWYEKIGTAKTEQPFLYSVFKRNKPGDNIVQYARRLYAPPLIRALYKAVHASLTSL